MDNLKIGDRVNAIITKNGYWVNSYKGEVVGFTKNNRVKVESYRGIKMHSIKNIRKIW